jgi:nucleotide-binding universal stress UspA family protein
MIETSDAGQRGAIRFDRILFATDFSPISAMALPYAAAIARRFSSTLYVLHVISAESHADLSGENRDEILAGLRQQAEQRITALLASSHFQGIAHQVLLEQGDILPVLSSVAQKQNVDLIVAGTHGRHGLQKLLLGSVAEEISRLVRLPVLLIGPEVRIPPEAEVRIQRILHVTDFSAGSRRAMDYAYALARAYAAQLYFLHVSEDATAEPLSARMPPQVFFRARFQQQHWPQAEQGITAQFLVEFGSPERISLEVAENRNVQLIVLGEPETTHLELSAHLPGPLAYNVMSHARCPVLVIRAAASGTGGTAARAEQAGHP